MQTVSKNVNAWRFCQNESFVYVTIGDTVMVGLHDAMLHAIYSIGNKNLLPSLQFTRPRHNIVCNFEKNLTIVIDV